MPRRLALAAVVLAAANARAADVVVVAPDQPTGPYAEAFKGVCDALGVCPPLLPPSAALPPGTRVVVALGGHAARKRLPAKTVLITALCPGFEARRGDADAPLVRVRLTPSPAEFVRRLQRLSPRTKRVAMLWDAEASGRYAAEVRDAARARGVEVVATEVAESGDLPGALRSLPDVDAIWLAPDPDLVTPGVFAEVAEAARARGAAFFSPAPGLTHAGADAGLAPTFRAAGLRAGQAAREALTARPASEAVYPDDAAEPPPALFVSTPSAGLAR
ncbi:MAG: hypothetical protein HY079_03365 [Elusimicrobia bacterium]|nr:hypothetical protein [Elusimicrobiota bacterium]